MVSKRMNNIFNVFVLLVLLLVIVMPHFMNSYLIYIFTVVGTYAVVAQGLNVLTGFAGQFSIGHSGFMAIGAYITGYSAMNWTKNILAIWIMVIAATALVGFLLGYVCLRMKGPYLALATMGFMVIISRIAVNWRSVTGGSDGLIGIPSVQLGPLVFNGELIEYYLTLATLVLTLFIMKFLRESRIGRAMFAVKDDEIGARLSGVNVTYYKVLAFVISAVMGGISGSLYTVVTKTVFPNFFDIQLSSLLMMIIVIGGAGSIPGVTMGTVIIVSSFELLRELRQWQMVVYCVLVILCILFLPKGIMGFINKCLNRFGIQAGKMVTIPPKIIRAQRKS